MKAKKYLLLGILAIVIAVLFLHGLSNLPTHQSVVPESIQTQVLILSTSFLFSFVMAVFLFRLVLIENLWMEENKSEGKD